MSEKKESRLIAGTMERQGQKTRASEPCFDFTAGCGKYQALIAPILCEGAENAQTAKALAAALGLSDVRSVTRQVECERLRGIPICACSGGYYLPRSATELASYTRRFGNRRRHIGKTAAALEYALAVMSGQEIVGGAD